MSSRFDGFLENDDRYKLFIYQILQARSAGISIEEIKKQVELSDFKFNNLIEELKSELQELNSQIIVDNKWLLVENFSAEDYQKLRLFYFKRSLATDFLLKVGLFESVSRAEFASIHYISDASVYNIQSDINNLLVEFGLKIKNSQIVGEEKNIRSFYFQLLFSYYGGLESPFLVNVRQLIDQNIRKINSELTETLTIVQRNQLAIFLGIQFYRIKNENYVSFDLQLPAELINKVEIFKSDFSVREVPQCEETYLLLFLVLNDYAEIDLHFEQTNLEKKLLSHLNQKLRISKLANYLAIRREIEQLSQKWYYFKMTSTIFVSDQQFDFFVQNYPILHEVTYQFVTRISKVDRDRISEPGRKQLYLEIMFCLLSFNEIRQSELPINIFVDFSGGKDYNSYISENIEYFRYLNIKLMDQLTEQVDLYISDFTDDQLTCQQIIWKAPPLDTDWERFANIIVEMKGRIKNIFILLLDFFSRVNFQLGLSILDMMCNQLTNK